MAIDSRAYNGEVGWSAWAEYAGRMGGKYTVLTAGAMKVTAKTTGTRVVTIAPGAAVGAGIYDVNDAALDYTDLPEVLSGSRWFLVGLRRRWGSGLNVTDVFHIAGATGTAVPTSLPTRPQTPGSEDFQPLALVRIDAGQSAPQAVLDLRVWVTNGGATGAPDAPQLVRQYITEVGSRITFGSEDWQVQVDGAGNAAWRQLNAPPGVRPFLVVARYSAFGGLVAGSGIPFYAGLEANHVKEGAWSDTFAYSNGATGAANPIGNTAPAYIQTKREGTYAYGLKWDATSAGNASDMAVACTVGAQAQADPYWSSRVAAGERVYWTLTNELWLPAGARFSPRFGKASGGIQVNAWEMWMTRTGD